jgi:NAD(P)H-dependent FMN reductase
MKKIIAISGSTRADSLNGKLLQFAKGLAPEGFEIEILNLKDFPMPFYDGDYEDENGLPENAMKLKEIFAMADGLLFASPEYNSSVSAILKNTLDWLSRPGGTHNPFADKFALITAASPSASGGIRGLYHLESILQNFGVFVLPDKFALREAHNMFEESGNIKEPILAKQLKRAIAKLALFIEKY